MYLSVYLIGTFTDSIALQCNAMHRAMYCTECFFKVGIGIGV